MSGTDLHPVAEHRRIAEHRALAIGFLKTMLTIRELEQRALDLSRTDPPTVRGSIHLCAGQESVPTGAIAGLDAADQIIGTYRGHGWALACGLSLIEVLGEICHRTIGINGGRGGSAYMMAPHGRFIGENSIVGAGLPLACGVALANRHAGNGKVVLVSLGDGAFNQGATHEGLAFAAARNLPVLIICENNGWSEMTPTTTTFKVGRIADRAAGYGIPGVTMEGTDPHVVMEAVRHAAARARAGDGPTLIEFQVARLWGHYNNDIEHYRSVTDRTKAQQRDPIVLLGDALVRGEELSAGELDAMRAGVKAELDAVIEEVMKSPQADPATAKRHVWAENATPIKRRTQPRAVESIEIPYIRAVNEALRRELEDRPETLVYGEDLGVAGGIFGASRNLQRTFGAERVFDTPISESAILGSAIGAAMMGLKPIVEIMWADFMLVALDQLVNQAANIRYITGGRTGAAIVVRTQQGATPGSCAQHSQCLEALLAHIPGLRVGLPATPQDAYNMLRSAASASDPCILFEARALYQAREMVSLSDEIEPIGKARLHRLGEDAVVVTWGTQLPIALRAAESLSAEGLEVGVLDLRWLSPLDDDALVGAVKAASGRVVVAHEANLTGGFGAEIVARLHERVDGLKALRVATPDIRMPASPALQQELLPSITSIAAAARKLAKGD